MANPENRASPSGLSLYRLAPCKQAAMPATTVCDVRIGLPCGSATDVGVRMRHGSPKTGSNLSRNVVNRGQSAFVVRCFRMSIVTIGVRTVRRWSISCSSLSVPGGSPASHRLRTPGAAVHTCRPRPMRSVRAASRGVKGTARMRRCDGFAAFDLAVSYRLGVQRAGGSGTACRNDCEWVQGRVFSDFGQGDPAGGRSILAEPVFSHSEPCSRRSLSDGRDATEDQSGSISSCRVGVHLCARLCGGCRCSHSTGEYFSAVRACQGCGRSCGSGHFRHGAG